MNLITQPMARGKIALTLFLLIPLGLFLASRATANELSPAASLETVVFQASGLDKEGIHPVFLTQAPTKELSQALTETYLLGADAPEKALPRSVQIIVPDTMTDDQMEAYLESLRSQVFNTEVLIKIPLVLVKIPVKEVLIKGDQILESRNQSLGLSAAPALEPMLPSEKERIDGFYGALQSKLKDLRLWAQRMNQWSRLTAKEKDHAVLTIFGAARGIPGVAIYANDAGTNPFNIARMIIAYGADIFFTVAPQKLADVPKKIKIPDLKKGGETVVSWGASVSLMGLGYWGYEASPSYWLFQLGQASPAIQKWFNHNVELKSFLFNYALSLGIPMTFITLGYYAKGGAGPGVISPFDVSFLLQFAGLQVMDGVMGMFGSRGARVMGVKGYFSGRGENIFYSLLNVIGQAQGLAIATSHESIYRYCLFVKNAIQGLIFLTSRILPQKAPKALVFQGDIGPRDRASHLYMEGLVDPKALSLDPKAEGGTLNEFLHQIELETQGPATLNRWLRQFGRFFERSHQAIERESEALSETEVSLNPAPERPVRCQKSLRKWWN